MVGGRDGTEHPGALCSCSVYVRPAAIVSYNRLVRHQKLLPTADLLAAPALLEGKCSFKRAIVVHHIHVRFVVEFKVAPVPAAKIGTNSEAAQTRNGTNLPR